MWLKLTLIMEGEGRDHRRSEGFRGTEKEHGDKGNGSQGQGCCTKRRVSGDTGDEGVSVDTVQVRKGNIHVYEGTEDTYASGQEGLKIRTDI